MSFEPKYGDPDNTLLFKIAEILNAGGGGGGGGGAGVSSFNARTGAVSLTTGDVTGALGFTPEPALGYTPENVANKSIDGTLAANSDTLYPSQKAVKTYADTKQAALGFTPENVANKSIDGTLAANSDTLYPSQKAVKTYADAIAAAGAAAYVLKAGDNMTGALTLATNKIVLNVDGSASFGTGVFSIGSTGALAIATNKILLNIDGTAAFTGFVQMPFLLDLYPDALTGSAPVVAEFSHALTGGTAGVNFGTSIDISMDSTTTTRQVGARISTIWSDATHATRTSLMRFFLPSSATLTEVFRIAPAATTIFVGNLLFTDNTQDIGASGASRPRTLFLGTSEVFPSVSQAALRPTGTLEYDGTDLKFTSSAFRRRLSKRIASTVAISTVSTWTTRTDAVTNGWSAIAWSPALGLFAAVSYSGAGNRVMTSPDGITWTARTSAANNNWDGIAWSPELGLFAAVAYSGTGNRVMTSPDGITWTARTSAADNDWVGIAWSPELGLFAAVADSGTGNRVMTSPDGITWTSRTSASDNNWAGIAWSPELGLFAATAFSGTGNRVMTSPDGITWTSRTSAADNDWAGIAWSPELGLFATVAQSGTGNRVMTSPDGITWTSRTSAANNSWYAIAWSPELGLFAATAQSGTVNRVMTSPDGITWTTRTTTDNGWLGIAWSPELGLFAAVGAFATGSDVMTAGILVSIRGSASLNVLKSGDTMTGALTATAFNIGANPLNLAISAYAAGTVYTLTATNAKVDFGTTDPAITITAAGTYRLSGSVKVQLNGATFAANQTVTILIRRTNNTAGNLTNSGSTFTVPIVTTLTQTLAIIRMNEVLYTTANTNDALEIWADVSALPSAGTISIDAASLVAIRIA